MATNTRDRRPDPARDQQEALNKAVAKGAIQAPAVDASSLDTFNKAPAALEAAGLAIARDGEGIRRIGSDDNIDTQSGFGTDEQAAAEETAQPPRDAGQDGEEYQSPFEFAGPGRARMEEEMARFMPQEDQEQGGPGTAAGKHSPGSSGGDGGVSSDGSGANGTQRTFNDGRGGGGGQDVVDPFTGQAIGTGAYAAPGAPGLPGMDAVGGFQVDPQMAALMASMPTGHQGDGSPSVADGEVSGFLAAVAGAIAPVAPEAAAAVGVVGAAVWAVEQGVEAKQGLDASRAERARILNENGNLQSLGSPEAAPAAPPDQSIEKTGQSVEPDEDNPAGLEYTDNQGNRIELTPAQQINGLIYQESRGVTPRVKDDRPPDMDQGGPPTQQEIAFRAHLYQATNYHGGPRHNEGVTNPTEDAPIERGPAPRVTADRDREHSMVGQPNPEGPSGVHRAPSLGILPGDFGNIDPGEGSDTGGWTSNSQTEEPADALDSLGGSGLGIGDARRDEEEDDDDSDSAS